MYRVPFASEAHLQDYDRLSLQCRTFLTRQPLVDYEA